MLQFHQVLLLGQIRAILLELIIVIIFLNTELAVAKSISHMNIILLLPHARIIMAPLIL